MRHLVTDVALLAYISKKKLGVVSYTEATKACKSSSSASRALHQLINEGILDPQPKLIGLRYVTQYVVTDKGKKVADLALQLTQLREVARMSRDKKEDETPVSEEANEVEKDQVSKEGKKAAGSDRLELFPQQKKETSESLVLPKARKKSVQRKPTLKRNK